jgi:hypothetical protein
MQSFFHFGISAITEPFHGIILSLWDFGYHGAFSWNHSFALVFRLTRSLFMESFFHFGISAITEPFSNFPEFFLMLEIHKTHNLGEDSFHIYHKEYLHTTLLTKNLAS